jgi:hypothetical protein
MSETETLTCQSVLNNVLDYSLIEDEFLNFFRLNLTDSKDRALYATESFTSDGSNSFELTGDLDSANRHKIMAMKEVTINGVVQTLYKDYNLGFRNDSNILGIIYFWNAPASGSIISVKYYYKYSMVFAEKPRVNLTTNSYPRVSFEIASFDPTDVAIGGKVHKFDIVLRLTIIDVTKNNVQKLAHQIHTLFTDEAIKHGFHTLKYVRNPKMTPIIDNGEDQNDVVYMQQIDLESPNQYQISK